jgi:hypothetical protein
MKKLFLTLFICSSIVGSAYANLVVTTNGTTITATDAGKYVFLYDYTQPTLRVFYGGLSPQTWGNVGLYATSLKSPNYAIFSATSLHPCIADLNVHDCMLDASYTGQIQPFIFFGTGFTGTYMLPDIENGVSTMIRNATTSFMAITGFTPAQSISSVGSIFIMPFIGGGIMMLQALLPWIIVLVVLSAFVYFAYRSFRFYGENKRKNIK